MKILLLKADSLVVGTLGSILKIAVSSPSKYVLLSFKERKLKLRLVFSSVRNRFDK